MARLNKFTNDEEDYLKMQLLDAIIWNGNVNTTEVIQDLPELKAFQVRYYMHKFQLNFTEPYANDEDLAKYEVWCIEEERKGGWLGPLTLPENIPAEFKEKFAQTGHTGRHCFCCGDPIAQVRIRNQG